MPHGTNNTMSKQTTVNGEVPNSHPPPTYSESHNEAHFQTIDHVKSYPLVADLSKEIQNNSVGARSISTFNYLYANLAQPVFPYLRTPYSIIKPYLQQADSIGDSSLNHVDEKFPAVKSTNLEKVKTAAFDTLHYPFKLAGQGKDYVFTTYGEEYKKVSGDGIFAHGKAIVSTELHIAGDAWNTVMEYVRPKTEKARADYDKLKKAGEERMEKAKKVTQEKKDQVVNST